MPALLRRQEPGAGRIRSPAGGERFFRDLHAEGRQSVARGEERLLPAVGEQEHRPVAVDPAFDRHVRRDGKGYRFVPANYSVVR